MPVSYVITLPVSTEPVTLTDAKSWLRVDYPDEDILIAQLITEARDEAERITKRALATQTIQAILEPGRVPVGALSGPVDSPPDAWQLAERPDIPLFGNALVRLKLPMSPVQSITTVEYQLTRMDNPEWTTLAATDTNGNATYRLDSTADPAELNIFTVLAASRYRVTYVAGYTVLPRELEVTLKRLIAHYYTDREGEKPIPQAIMDGLYRKRVFEL